MKKSKRIIACIFTTVFIIGCLYMGKANADSAKNATLNVYAADLDIWSCHSSIKVLRGFFDKDEKEFADPHYYDDVRESAKISITMARGEYESAQIIITPKVDVPYYNATISDLKTNDGINKIGVEKIKIYHEKYLPVTVNYENNNEPLGLYPDALVPMSSIVERKENNIKANANQGVYVSIESALDQAVGVYTGSLTLDFKTYQEVVPVTVEVIDLTVSEEAHAKSTFECQWYFEHGELDTTQRVFDSYVNKLIEYRLAPYQLNDQFTFNDATIYDWVERAYDLIINPRCSNLSIPYAVQSGKCLRDVVRADLLERVLNAVAEKCFAENVNMFKKLVMYISQIDEPDGSQDPKPHAQVQENCEVFNNTVKKIADALEADTTKQCQKKAEIIESLRKIPNIVTAAKQDDYIHYDDDNYINAFCPKFYYLNDEESRKAHKPDGEENAVELWWYGCNDPIYPYVNYHLEHSNNLNTRLLSWMQAEYNIDGNLYWSVNDYEKREDYFDFNPMNMYGVTTEGILFYPGGQYGLDEPIPSLRLEGIRDGLEEYELLYAMKQKYAELGLPNDKFVSTLSEGMYTGAMLVPGLKVSTYVQAREQLLREARALSEPGQLCIISSDDLKNGKKETKVFTNGLYELKNGGVVLTDYQTVPTGRIYTIVSNLTQSQNYIDLSYEANNKTYSYRKYIGGKAETVSANEFYAGFEDYNATVTASIVDGASVGLQGNVAKVAVAEVNRTTSQIIGFDSAKINGYFNGNVSKILFSIYNDSNKDIKISFNMQCEFEKKASEKASSTLTAKTTTVIELDLSTIDWAVRGNMKTLRIKLGDDNDKTAKTLYFGDAFVYFK